MMNKTCFVCNKEFGLHPRNAISIFGESSSQKLPQISNILSEVTRRPVSEDNVHTNIICGKCQKLCIDYYVMNEKLKKARGDLQEMIKNTLVKQQIVDTEQLSVEGPIKEEPNIPVPKRVLSSSKLRPLSNNSVLNADNMNRMVKTAKPTFSSSTTNTGTTLLKTYGSARPNILKTKNTTYENPKPSSDTSISNAVTYNVNEKKSHNYERSFSDNMDEEQVSEEECNLAEVPHVVLNSIIDKNDREPVVTTTYVTYNNIDEVIGDSKMEDPDDEEEQTIVMDEENGSILQMMSGKTCLYSGDEYTLIMQSDHEDNQDNDPIGYESDDEAAIEFEVDGDEETTRAIIAAASKEGDTYIKVDTGEFYRVHSVQSATTTKPKNHESNHSTLIEDMIIEEDGQFRCLLCQNADESLETTVVGNAETITAHLKTKHNARVFVCTICNRLWQRKADLSIHNRTCHAATISKSKAIKCSICNKAFNSKRLLGDHMNIHTGNRPYTCTVCNKGFPSKYTLQAHLKTHTDRPRPFKCTKCPKAFLNQATCTQHERTHLGIKDFLCNVCNKSFSSQHNLEVHRVVHAPSKPYSCDRCDKSFARRNEVQDHIRTHTGERPFACEICGAAFTQRSNLHSHRKATHFNEARHACQICTKKFKRRRLLDYHIMSAHTGERPLVCEICHATFVYPEHFRKHKRIHSGEKPYNCEVCGKTFNSRDNRNTHRFVHSDKKPYECLSCGIGYMRKRLLYAHMNTAAHVTQSIVVNTPRLEKVKSSDRASCSPSHAEDNISIHASELAVIEGDENNKTDDGDDVTKTYLTNTDCEQKYEVTDSSGILKEEAVDNPLYSILSNMDGTNSTESSPQVAIPSENPHPHHLCPVKYVTPRSNMSKVQIVTVPIHGGGVGWMAVASD